MSAVASSPMPRWDLDVYFPGLDSSEFVSAFTRVKEGIAGLEQGMAKLEAGGPMSLEAFLRSMDSVLEEYHLLEAYVYGKFTVDTRDALAQARSSELDLAAVPLKQLRTRFAAWAGGADLSGTLASPSQFLAQHEYFLRRCRIRAEHLMTPPEEALAAELGVTGSTAWGKLHDSVTSQLDVEVDLPGGRQTLPMSAVRALAHDADREARRAAYEAELAKWKTVETPLASAMNSIKGEVNTLSKRRRWESGLDEAVFENAIDRATLDAMLACARESFPDFRRYLKARAKALGLDRCEWYDLFGPVKGDDREYSVEEACDFVAEQFDAFSQKMGDFARRSYRENWTDFEPRPGKIDGAYCMGTRADESRVLMNYKPSFGSVKTLAHELGHGYHNLCLAGRPQLVQESPSTLAETASIFCETVVKNAALANATGKQKMALLDACLEGPCQTIVDITSRFQFEKAVFDGRRDRELSADELCATMLQAQKDTYGDGLASYHPYMWAVKPHYYSTWSFYNFPYMFGLLFALGLYDRFLADPNGFRARYDDLLSSTGMADAAELGQRFGFDTRSIEFWRGSFNVLRKDIDEFVGLVGA